MTNKNHNNKSRGNKKKTPKTHRGGTEVELKEVEEIWRALRPKERHKGYNAHLQTRPLLILD